MFAIICLLPSRSCIARRTSLSAHVFRLHFTIGDTCELWQSCFHAIIVDNLFETDLLLIAFRILPFFVARKIHGIFSILWGIYYLHTILLVLRMVGYSDLFFSSPRKSEPTCSLMIFSAACGGLCYVASLVSLLNFVRFLLEIVMY